MTRDGRARQSQPPPEAEVMTEKRDRPARPEQPGTGGFEEGQQTLPDDEPVGKFSEGGETLPDDERVGKWNRRGDGVALPALAFAQMRAPESRSAARLLRTTGKRSRLTPALASGDRPERA